MKSAVGLERLEEETLSQKLCRCKTMQSAMCAKVRKGAESKVWAVDATTRIYRAGVQYGNSVL